MKIKNFAFNPFRENTYVVYDDTKECVIIDCGCYTEEEVDEIVSFISFYDLKPVKLVNTHCHVDHLMGINYLKEKYGIPFWANFDDNYLISSAEETAKSFGFSIEQPPEPDFDLAELDKLDFGATIMDILKVPGHTPGHVAFLNKSQKVVFTGDVLFKGTIGRTDLPGGDYDQLRESIFTKLLTLDEETVVYPGHGDITTIGYEKKSNPFLE